MTRLLIHVEGETEESFVNEVLAPHLYTHGYGLVSARLLGNARQRDRRGSSTLHQAAGCSEARSRSQRLPPRPPRPPDRQHRSRHGVFAVDQADLGQTQYVAGLEQAFLDALLVDKRAAAGAGAAGRGRIQERAR